MIKDMIKYQIKKTDTFRALEIENEKLEVQIVNLENKIKMENQRLKITENKLKTLNEEKKKLCTVPNFDGLNKTLKGKDSYLFLINDSNNEIRQHFDQYYSNHFKRIFIY